MIKTIYKHNKIYVIIFMYLITGIFTLSWCPRVFVDEPDISSTAYQKSNNITISPNMPVCSKNKGTTFLLQTESSLPFIKYFGHTPLSIRIPGYLCFLASLIFLYLFFLKKYNTEFAVLYCVLFGLQFPIFWASHIFRPEIYIIFFQSICLFILTRNKNPENSFLLGLFSSIGIFAHLIVLWLPFVIAGLYFLPYFKDRKTLLSKYREFLSFASGVIISLSLYYLLIDKGTLSGMVNFGVSQRKSLLHALYTFSKMVGKYFIADGGWRIILIIISLTIIIRNLIKNPRKVIIEISPFLFGLCSTFLLLTLIGRTSRLYLSFLNIWFLFFLVFSISLISNIRLRQSFKIILFLLFAGYISLFATATYKLDLNNYYNKLSNACDSLDKNAKVLGRSQHHYYLPEKIQYIYEWDLFSVIKESKTDILERYYNKNHFDYIILDPVLLNFQNDATSTAGFLQRHAIKLTTIIHPYGGSRIMDYPIFGGVIKFLYNYNKSSKKSDETIIYKINHQSFKDKI